ncbi:hypothetical protein CN520_24465 [Bacillus cereus]|uniref:hypothetical protein n=1 Tax=Bacillus cereus TaxID=1396 RepID=UPI000BF8BC30|nr:hypothetical protein [Bacillus cereus]PET37896.1 hypothetical protein CN520_24465 [Bacillus cereus]PEY79068.1 hypothetical protein CN344_10500 [Bacillus cereus]PFW12849.1 hypothetical protein COL12_03075 [Bacillus cereus]PGP76267.1 hypothetical protein CN999_28110 [Bacillus cereus]
MSFIKEIKLLVMDMLCKKMYIFLWLLILLFCVVSLVKQAVPIKGEMGFPQCFEFFFSSFTFVFPVLPLFLIFLAYGIIPFFEPFRFIRYKKREHIFLALLLRIFLIVFLFTVFYLLSGFLVGGLYSGNWNNVWLTKKGLPYAIYGEQLALSKYFETWWMLIRYIMTSLFLFNLIGIIVVICYVLIPRYIYSFIIICTLSILDKTLQKIYGISLLNKQLTLGLNEWLRPETFQNISYLFGGIWIVLTVVLYIIMEKKDYFSNYKSDNGQNT